MRPIADLSLDLDVNRLLECFSIVCQLAPDHDAVPFRAAVAGSRLVLPARFCGERERRQGRAILQLSRFGIGTDKPDEIDVILEHCLFLLFVRTTQRRSACFVNPYGFSSPNRISTQSKLGSKRFESLCPDVQRWTGP